MIYTLIPLGNPGEKYAHTRHNAARYTLAFISEDIHHVSGVEIFIPTSFMNESGRDIAEYLRYHEDRELIVLYDDKDIPFGRFKIAHDRGDGGHNGLKSVIDALGKTEFTRIRIGIAPKDTDGKEILPPHGEEVQKYVLNTLTEEEKEVLRTLATPLLAAIKMIERDGYKKAMEVYNKK
jgi:PTH1 family peptidyl-tRNA hydrolase